MARRRCVRGPCCWSCPRCCSLHSYLPATGWVMRSGIVMQAEPLLAVRELCLNRADGPPVLRGLSFDVQRGEIVGVVGQSGSGKSQLLLSLLGLAMRGGSLSGSAKFGGRELVGASERTLRGLRGT